MIEVSYPITHRQLCLRCPRPAPEPARQNSSFDGLRNEVFPIQAAGSIPLSKPSPREPGMFKTVLGHAKRRPAAKLYRKSAAIAASCACASLGIRTFARFSKPKTLHLYTCCLHHKSKHGWLPQASKRKTSLRRHPLLGEAT